MHGEPLKPEEVLATKKALGWPSEEPFFVPAEARERFAAQAAAGEKDRKRWIKLWKNYSEANQEKAELAKARVAAVSPAPTGS